MIVSPPEPHPLDYDWRFSEKTIQNFCNLICGQSRNVLCIGTPSLAARIESAKQNVTLVDRQPLQLARNVCQINPDVDKPIADEFHIAVLDPPWYENVFFRWISWAAQVVTPNDGVIYCSLWPLNTRPNASSEHDRLFKWLKSWALIRIVGMRLEYEIPLFEERAQLASHQPSVRAWREGELLEIRPFSKPKLLESLEMRDVWHRIVINSYQLAVRLDHTAEAPSITKHPEADGWIWKSVSNRAIGREQIGLWSSRNEVAMIKGGASVINAIGELVSSGIIISPSMKCLEDWEIPRENIYRFFEWKHRN